MTRLDAINVGDALAIYGNSGRGSLEKGVVTRTTKTRINVGDMQLTRSGSKVGAGTWSMIFAEPWDEARHARAMRDIAAQAKLESARRELRNFAWHSITAEQAETALALVASWGAKP